MLQLALLGLLLGPALGFTLPRSDLQESSGMIWRDDGSVGRVFDHGPRGNVSEEDAFTISALLDQANKDLEKRRPGLSVTELDIAAGYGLQNAGPCTAQRCKWPKARDGKVNVPYRISTQYSSRERAIIEDGLRSFGEGEPPRTCIRFIPRTRQRDFLDIISDEGCYSYLGKQRGGQTLSLQRGRPGCVVKHIVQHELIHALGFVHEHSRSDRDEHVRIVTENIVPGALSQFRKVQTNNLRTPYDYNSVMQYGRDFFTRNGRPTIVPIPDENVEIGTATEMSSNDILRINRLYGC